MNRYTKRALALLLALVMMVGVLPGITGQAQAASYTPNWGRRGDTAMALSQQAENFYTGTNTYTHFAALSGADERDAVPDSPLYEALQDFMTQKHTHITSYNETKTLYRYTDCQEGDYTSTGAISSFYSGKALGPDWDGNWNREHTWPNSKGEGDAENDIMMLRPTATSENSSRGNKAYGLSTGYYDPNKVSNGTYNLHGDVARIMLYVYVRWGNTEFMWGSEGVLESVELMLDWIEEDPVDTWELGRNDAVQSITGTRNVFVDYPELAFLMFEQPIPTDMDTPSGMASGESLYAITAQSSNTAHGTVALSGKTITATPATGYEASGYTVVTGSAQVTQRGNAFTVEASTACTVRIQFTPRTAASLRCSEDGTVTAAVNGYVGDKVTLPQAEATPQGWNFLGWTAESVDSAEEKPQVYEAGTKYTLTGDTTLYALYSVVDESGQGGNVYAPYTGIITPGSYLIVSNGAAMVAQEVNGPRLGYQEVTVTAGTIQSPEESLIWQVAASGDAYTLFNQATGKYAVGIGEKSRASLSATLNNYAKWKVSGTEAYDFYNLGNQNAGVNYTLRRNSTYGFACYSINFGSPVELYKQAQKSVSYTTGALPPESTPTPTPTPEGQIETTPMYRLYNPNSGEHFYTGSIEERDMLEAAGWDYEGVAWNAPIYVGAPVYRVYNPNSGDHHYTMSLEEKDMLVGVGWIYEGVAWNSSAAWAEGTNPLYRLYNPNADCGSHHYTGSTEEKDNLVSVGWIYEGVGWFGMLR